MSDRESQPGADGKRAGRISSAPGLSRRLEKARVRVARTNLKRKLHDAAAATEPNPDRITLGGGNADPNDKRASERLDVSLPLQVRRAGSREASDDRCRDLTPTGMFIATGEPLTLGSIIAFDCSYGLLRRFGGMARVVWTRPVTNQHGPRGVGVCFLDLDVTGVEAIEFILRHAADNPDAIPTARTESGAADVESMAAGGPGNVRSITPTSSVIVDPDVPAAPVAQGLDDARSANANGTAEDERAAAPVPATVDYAPLRAVVAAGSDVVAQRAPSGADLERVVNAPTIEFERPRVGASMSNGSGTDLGSGPSTWSGAGPAGPAGGSAPVHLASAKRPPRPGERDRTTPAGAYSVTGGETTVVSSSSVPPDRQTLRGRPPAGSPSRRRAPRADVCVSLQYISPRTRVAVQGTCRNLSDTGMFLATSHPLDVGESLDVRMPLADGASIRGSGRVRWCRRMPRGPRPAGMAVEFVALDPGAISAIQRLMARPNDAGPLDNTDGPAPAAQTHVVGDAPTRPRKVDDALGRTLMGRPPAEPKADVVSWDDGREATVPPVPSIIVSEDVVHEAQVAEPAVLVDDAPASGGSQAAPDPQRADESGVTQTGRRARADATGSVALDDGDERAPEWRRQRLAELVAAEDERRSAELTTWEPDEGRRSSAAFQLGMAAIKDLVNRYRAPLLVASLLAAAGVVAYLALRQPAESPSTPPGVQHGVDAP